jgi:hypothetical protein
VSLDTVQSKLSACVLFFLAILTLCVPSSAAGQAPELTADLVSKHYSSGLLPVVDAYVEYELKLTNHGSTLVEDHLLIVSLISEENRSGSIASYSILLLDQGESKNLHLGPFKMNSEGEHQLLLELEHKNEQSTKANIPLRYRPDSFIVYRQEAIWTIVIAASFVSTGAMMIGFLSFRKRRK